MKFLKEYFTRHTAAGRVYADAAASTPVHPRVKARMRKLLEVYGNPLGLHKEAVAAGGELASARAQCAAAISAHPDEVVFTSGATESNNASLLGVLYPLLRKNKHVHAITTEVEHPSILEPLLHLKKYGLSITFLSVDSEGLISLKDLRDAVTQHTALISVQMVNSETGVLQPLREVAKEVRYAKKLRAQRGSTFPLYLHSDAAQAPLFMEVVVEQLGVDLLSIDAQKILGPKGSGLLYRRRDVILEPIMFGGGQEKGLRSGTQAVLLAGALAEALTLAKEGLEERVKEVTSLRNELLENICAQIPDVIVHGSRTHRIANNLSISIPGLEGEKAVIALDAFGAAAATRAACAISDEDPSHVLLAMGVPRERAVEAIRITLLPDVSRADIALIHSALSKTVKLYRT